MPANAPALLPPGVLNLHRRVQSGLAATFASVLDDREPTLTDETLWRYLDRTDTLADTPGPTSDEVDRDIVGLAGYLAGHRDLLLAVLVRPAALVELAARRARHPDHPWLQCCWAMEAAWRVVDSGKVSDRQFAAGDLVRLRPVAARQRFIVLTEPLRAPAGETSPDGGIRVEPARIAFGADTAHDMLDRCRQARWNWLVCLREYQSHPRLAKATSADLETELDLLVFRDGPGSAPLTVSWWAASADAGPGPDDQAAADEVVQRHLLPRFRIGRVARLAIGHGGTGAVPWALVVAASALAAIGLAAAGWFIWAAGMAAMSYLALGAGVVQCGRTWAAPWLLRLPAAGAFGLVALTTLHPDWWTSSHRWGWAAALLVAASYGYLVVEARNHGLAPVPAMGRALGVMAVAATHALLVSLLGLVLVTPEYSEQGALLAGVWSGGHWPPATAWTVLLSGAAWCLAVGVFSQILWDDRPITAPLAHMRWTRKG